MVYFKISLLLRIMNIYKLYLIKKNTNFKKVIEEFLHESNNFLRKFQKFSFRSNLLRNLEVVETGYKFVEE